MVVAEEEIHFLASKKKIDFLRQIQNSNKDENGLPAKLELHIRDRVNINYLLDRMLECKQCFCGYMKYVKKKYVNENRMCVLIGCVFVTVMLLTLSSPFLRWQQL
jgi:hypothetical protein